MPKKPRTKDDLFLAALFFSTIAAFLAYYYLRERTLTVEFWDGELYISIADNFLRTGRFTQTMRPYRQNMVVPFGVPLLLLPVRIATKSKYAVMILQLALYGLTGVFAHLTEKNFFKTKGIVSWAFFLLATFYRVECSPLCVGCTESWYIFFIAAGLYVLSLENITLEKKLLWLNILTYLAMIVRPFLSPLYIITVCATLYLSLLKKRAGFAGLLQFYAVSSIILIAFLFINHRETGQWVLFENYASMDLWWANNENSDPLDSNIAAFYDRLYDSTGVIDHAKDGDMYKHMFREYVLTHPGKFVSDTLLKFYIMYIEHWAFMILPGAVSVVMLFLKKDRSRRLIGALFALFTIMSLTASVGIIVHRYTVFIIPFYGLLLSGGAKYALDLIKTKKPGRAG